MTHCSTHRTFFLYLDTLAARAHQGLPPEREDILRLLDLAPDAPETELVRRQADALAREITHNQGLVWSAIGVDRCPCAMNCRLFARRTVGPCEGAQRMVL